VLTRRSFLSGLGLTASALVLPSSKRVEDEIDEFIFARGDRSVCVRDIGSSFVTYGMSIFAFGADLAARRRTRLHVEMPYAHAQILGLSVAIDPHRTILVERLEADYEQKPSDCDPSMVVAEFDLRVFQSDDPEDFGPINGPLCDRMLMQLLPHDDTEITLAILLRGLREDSDPEWSPDPDHHPSRWPR